MKTKRIDMGNELRIVVDLEEGVCGCTIHAQRSQTKPTKTGVLNYWETMASVRTLDVDGTNDRGVIAYALCGFMFNKFVTDEYIRREL